MEIRTLTVGDLSTNCHLVSIKRSDLSTPCLIIDPGDEADYITQTIIENKLQPTSIVLTHGHFDHVLGCLELKLNFDIPIFLHQNDEKLYTSANQSALHWQKRKTLKVPPVDQFIKEGDKIPLGDEHLSVIETPGHTPGSICLYRSPTSSKRSDLSTPIIFTGDTLFANGVGRTDFSYSKPLQLSKSIDKLLALPEDTTIYPGHGEPSTIAECKLFIQPE